jgi:hypothetical protein
VGRVKPAEAASGPRNDDLVQGPDADADVCHNAVAAYPRWRRWLLLRLLGHYHEALVVQGKIPASDDVLDLMDGVSGWCSPHRRLA